MNQRQNENERKESIIDEINLQINSVPVDLSTIPEASESKGITITQMSQASKWNLVPTASDPSEIIEESERPDIYHLESLTTPSMLAAIQLSSTDNLNPSQKF